jgi:protein TonB
VSATAPQEGVGPPGAPLRLSVALLASAGLHLWLMFGVSVVAPRPSADAATILARLAARPAEPPPRLEPEAPPADAALPAARARPRVEPAAPSNEVRAERAAATAPPAPPSGLPPVEMPLLADLTWYPARQLDIYPKLVSLVQPRFPERADAQGVKGSVTLLIHIDEDGLARELAVVEADPTGYAFEEAAMEAYGAARWVPAVKDARYVRSRVLVRVTFEPSPGAQARTDD